MNCQLTTAQIAARAWTRLKAGVNEFDLCASQSVFDGVKVGSACTDINTRCALASDTGDDKTGYLTPVVGCVATKLEDKGACTITKEVPAVAAIEADSANNIQAKDAVPKVPAVMGKWLATNNACLLQNTPCCPGTKTVCVTDFANLAAMVATKNGLYDSQGRCNVVDSTKDENGLAREILPAKDACPLAGIWGMNAVAREDANKHVKKHCKGLKKTCCKPDDFKDVYDDWKKENKRTAFIFEQQLNMWKLTYNLLEQVDYKKKATNCSGSKSGSSSRILQQIVAQKVVTNSSDTSNASSIPSGSMNWSDTTVHTDKDDCKNLKEPKKKGYFKDVLKDLHKHHESLHKDLESCAKGLSKLKNQNVCISCDSNIGPRLEEEKLAILGGRTGYAVNIKSKHVNETVKKCMPVMKNMGKYLGRAWRGMARSWVAAKGSSVLPRANHMLNMANLYHNQFNQKCGGAKDIKKKDKNDNALDANDWEDDAECNVAVRTFLSFAWARSNMVAIQPIFQLQMQTAEALRHWAHDLTKSKGKERADLFLPKSHVDDWMAMVHEIENITNCIKAGNKQCFLNANKPLPVSQVSTSPDTSKTGTPPPTRVLPQTNASDVAAVPNTRQWVMATYRFSKSDGYDVKKYAENDLPVIKEIKEIKSGAIYKVSALVIALLAALLN